ncbi:MAG: hypothetical protein ACUVV6_06975 [Thermoplasmatota archaeon]
MRDSRLNMERVLDFARELASERECPCGWSWEIDCEVECALKKRPEIKYVDAYGNRYDCIFDATKLSESERVFLARTWYAVQLMARDIQPG